MPCTSKPVKLRKSDSEKIRATILLKGLQPHREVPNKNRGKRFAAGDIAGDRPLHEPGNSIEELQFWLVNPVSQTLQKAKVFLLGRITIILDQGKPCSSAENNPSVEPCMNTTEIKILTIQRGKSGLLNVAKFLKIDVTKQAYTGSEPSEVKLTLTVIKDIEDYVPYTADIDIDGRIGILKESSDDAEVTDTEGDDNEEEPFNVEYIIKKQFNAKEGQYEFLVKWKGYSEKHNTWELLSNIPDKIVNKFDLEYANKKVVEPPRRSGLRDRSEIKAKHLPEY